MSEMTEDRVREIVNEEMDRRKAEARTRLNDGLAQLRTMRERAAQTPAQGEEPPARRAAGDDRDGRGSADESTT